MGQYKLEVDPKITDQATIAALKKIIDQFYERPGAKDFLNMQTRPGGDYIVTTRPEAFIGQNKDQVIANQSFGERFRGYTQGTNNNLPKVTYINLNSDKDPLHVLIHEIGHIKWPGYAANNPNGKHDPEFYKLLGDSLVKFKLIPDQQKDLEGTNIMIVTSPAGVGNPLLFNVAPPRTFLPNRHHGSPDIG